MPKYLWVLPVVMLMVVLVGCHSNVTKVAQVTVDITTPDNNAEIDQGTATNIRAEVTSTEDIDKVEFRIDGDLVATRQGDEVATTATNAYALLWETATVALGQHAIEVKAYDTADPAHTGTDTVNVTIVQPPTAPPTVVIDDAPAEGSDVHAPFDVTVTATAQEPGATITKVDVTFGGVTETIDAASGTVSFTGTEASNGEQTILIVATDSLGVTGSRTRTVNVDNPPPTVEITAPAADATLNGEFDVTANATAHTAGATITKIDVSVNGQTKTINGAAGTVAFNTVNLQDGANTITAVATDSNGNTGQATRNVTVDNFTVTVENANVAAGANVTVRVVMSDTNGVAGFGMTVNYDQTKLELVGGDAAVAKGAAIPGGALLLPNTATPGVIRVAAAGTANFDNTKTEILTIAFKAIGAAGATVVDIDDTAGALTKLEFVDATATPLDPQPAAVDGTVTIQ